MTTLYLDSDFRCHLTDDGGRTPAVTEAFDGKCSGFVEGYRFVPEGMTWVRGDGIAFQGAMVAPVEDFELLEAMQRQYESDLAALERAYREGVNSL